MATDADLEVLKVIAACTDSADSETMARIIVRAMPGILGGRVGANGRGCPSGVIVHTLVLHLETNEEVIRAGMGVAVEKEWLVRGSGSGPIRLKLADDKLGLPGGEHTGHCDADLDALKLVAYDADLDDPEAMALLVLQSMPVFFPECVLPDGKGCRADVIVHTLAFHFACGEWQILTGVRAAIEGGLLARVIGGGPVRLKLAGCAAPDERLRAFRPTGRWGIGGATRSTLWE